MSTLQSALKVPFRVLRHAWRAVRPAAPRPEAVERAARPAPAPPVALAPLHIEVEETPNPDARKFLCGVPVTGNRGSLVVPDRAAAAAHPLARALFEVDGVGQVFATRDFVTITRTQGGPAWVHLERSVIDVLQAVVPR